MIADEQKSAALMLWPERQPTAAGEMPERSAWPFSPTRVPSFPTRFRQALRARSGHLNWGEGLVEPLIGARRSVLGDEAPRRAEGAGQGRRVPACALL